MITAKISSKGQITLPRSVRQALDVKPGQRVLFVVDARHVELRPLGPNSAKELAGVLRRYARGTEGATPVRSLVKKEVSRAAAQEG